jgi:Na+/H+ antiporter NhaD/arsenite permease-like protein
MISTYKPMALQYDTLQNILFVLGIFMAMSAVVETGFLQMLFVNISEYVTDLYCISVVLGFLSALFGNVCTMLAGISIFTQEGAATNPMLVADFMSDGDFWPLLSYTTALGASMLTIGSVSGFSLMKMEGVTISWYLRHFTFKVIAGWIAGLLVYVIIENSFWLNV